jgi:uncharacterized protein
MKKERKFNLHDGKFGAAITVQVTPKASQNGISEILSDGTIKIQVTAARVEGEANQALIEFLAAALQIAPANVEIVAGHGGSDKLITILGLDSAEVSQKLTKFQKL